MAGSLRPLATGALAMLKQRVLTAVPLALVVLAIVWWAPGIWTQGVMAAAMVMAAWEWADLAGLRAGAARLGYAGLVAGLIAVAALLDVPARAGWQVPGLIWWLGIAVWLLSVSRRSAIPPLPGWLRGAAGLITLTLAWLSVSAIHARSGLGPLWLTLLMGLVWGADIGGYFAGRRFGRRRLAATISPGKTWEGVAGGLLLALLVALGVERVSAGAAGDMPGLAWLLPVTVMVVVFSVVGDLAESLLKRQAGRKDSGRLLPGHGGLLDRIDALLAAAPVMAAALVSVS
ncbi:phosphatidate cytidylyltransferase [Spiribacter roseus]|uniref:phosphatidate cytidylyltransferase n=1 Tax=Spiribacter roseus TaxID=1855875 RepID=UPI00296F6F58